MVTEERILSAATTPSYRSPALVSEGKAPAATGLESRAGCVGVPPGGPALACQADRERLLLETLVLKRRLLESLQVGVRDSVCAPAHSLHLACVPSHPLCSTFVNCRACAREPLIRLLYESRLYRRAGWMLEQCKTIAGTIRIETITNPTEQLPVDVRAIMLLQRETADACPQRARVTRRRWRRSPQYLLVAI